MEKVRQAGYQPGMLHASDSDALFYARVPNLDAVRIGSAITGRTDAAGDYGLMPVGRLESAVAEVRWLAKGSGVGEGSDFITKHPIRVAIIPVGASDGFMVERTRCDFRFGSRLRHAMQVLLRRRSHFVNVGGKRARIIGRVGISHTTVDVSELDCNPGTPAYFDVDPMFVPDRIPRRYTDVAPIPPEIQEETDNQD